MPRTNYHLTDQDHVGSTGPQDAGAQDEHIEDNEPVPFTTPLKYTAVTATMNSVSYPQAIPGPLYPPYTSFFSPNEAGMTPTESLLTNGDVQFAIPATGEDDFAWPQSDAWGPADTTGFAVDTNMSWSSSSTHQTSPMPLSFWGMGSYEPVAIANPAWSVAQSSPFSTQASPTSARYPIARTSSSTSQRPILARYHSSSNTTFQPSPVGSKVEPVQQEPRAGAARPSKKRKSGLEPQEGEESGEAPPAPPAMAIPSPKNTIIVPEYSADGQASTAPRLPGLPSMPSTHEYTIPPQPPGSFAPPGPLPPPQPPPQALRERNRAAANKCRRKSKEVVADLEATERALSEEHQRLSQAAGSLRDEVLALKSALLVHGHCQDEVIQQYFTNSARLVGSGQAAQAAPAAQVSQAQRGQGGSSSILSSASRSRGRPSGFGTR